MSDGKRYNNLNGELKRIFGERVGKLSIDGGFTCPNRDGHLGNRGCLFCGEKGAGEFTEGPLSISMQVIQQMESLSRKWNSGKFIAYFQSFTNTYGALEKLKEQFEEALGQPGIVGLAIATRPDCLPEEVLDYLEELNNRTFLWVELGLQTIHAKTSDLIRRGYALEIYDKAVSDLKSRDIKTVTHLIMGLPNESKEQMLQSVHHVAKTQTWGIKLHSLYIQIDTDIYALYQRDPFPIMEKEEYADLIAEALTIIPPEMIIHRVTGDGDKKILFKPEWSADKLSVIASIDRIMKERNLRQGHNFKL
jgi:hypothetical protein